MSTDKKSKPAPLKDKKSKRKSAGSTSLPSADTAIEFDAPVNAPSKAKVNVVQPEKHQKEKSKGGAAKEVKRAEEPSSVSQPLSAFTSDKTKRKRKEKVPEEVEQPEDNAPAPSPPTPAEKRKKTNTKSGASETVTPTTKSSLTTVSKSISATSKASFPPKPHKASGKASQKSKKIEQQGHSHPASSTLETETAEEAGKDDSEQEGDENLHLHGFSTDDDDSSDEDDDMDYEVPALDISKLPTIAKDDATVKKKLEKAKRQTSEDRGVVYIGRVPHGFYEDQMRGYFSQFGDVTRVRLSRNKKTGRSKHYGFIEFNSSSVAQIVAETMDNYLLKGHILRCKVIPKDEVHPELWVGANRKWRVVPRDRLTRVHHNKIRTEDERVRAAKRLIKRQKERKRKLAKAGIDYDITAVSYKRVKAA